MHLSEPSAKQAALLSWQYSDGRYSISEADVDKLLDYRDNALRKYERDTGVYLQKVEVIVNALVDGGTGGEDMKKSI